MRSPFSSCSCAVKVREDTSIDLYELARGLEADGIEVEGPSCPRGRSLARLMRGALQAVRRAALAHREHVHRAYKLKLESLPPRLEEGGHTARTGQWVGLVEYMEPREGCIQLVIEPKYSLFHEIYREVVRGSSTLSQSLALAVADLHLGSPGSLPALNAAVWLIEEYAQRNPPYLAIDEPLQPARPVPPSLLPTRRMIRINERYYATLAASVSILSRTLAAASYPRTPLLDAMASGYAELQRRLLASLAADPRIIEALHEYWLEEPDEDVLLEVKAAARHAPAPGAARGAWLMLAPAPKIYEVYVLLKTAETLRRKHGGNVTVTACGQSIHCYLVAERTRRQGLARIYYNRPPRSFSRLVYKMTGSRPHPDILLAYNGSKTRVVVDAKYRLEFSLRARNKGSRLELAEALRLLGYIADLAHNRSLKAVLAVPEKNSGMNRLREPLDGLKIDVHVVEVNPRRGIAELVQAIPWPS